MQNHSSRWGGALVSGKPSSCPWPVKPVCTGTWGPRRVTMDKGALLTFCRVTSLHPLKVHSLEVPGHLPFRSFAQEKGHFIYSPGIQKWIWPSLQKSLTSSTEVHMAVVLGLPCPAPEVLRKHLQSLESLF